MPPRGSALSRDARLILAIQALRALVYGLGSVVIGVSLERSGAGPATAGAVLGMLVAGAAGATLLVGRFGDRLGRRRLYRILLLAMGVAGCVFAVTDWLPALLVAAVTGTVSTEVIESGPISVLEQTMLPDAASPADVTRLFGTYSTVAALAGSAGALLAAGGDGAQLLLLAYPVAATLGLVAAAALSPRVDGGGATRQDLHRPTPLIRRLALLFALDSFGGGFVVQAFIAYYLSARFDTPAEVIAVLFFTIGLLQTLSFQVAVRLARRKGLLPTMVVSHLLSNVLLVAVAFAPTLTAAIALLLARFALSQMDVPTRQAFVAALVEPHDRTRAIAYTSSARYLARPVGPVAAGAVAAVTLGGPFLLAGAIKTAYDLILFARFRAAPTGRT